MEKKFKLMPPSMPNFIFTEWPDPKQEGIKLAITDLTEDEAKEYAELMRNTFMEHYRKRKENLNALNRLATNP